MANCLIGLGSNLGDRGENLRAAIEHLKQLPQTTLLADSSFRDTKPAGGPTAQPPYLNAAARIETSLEPLQLFLELQHIENEFGRVREERWGPRTIDLDLLLYDQVELETPELTLPHPRMSFRRFVLEPAAEIAGEMVYPVNGWTIGKLIEHLNFRYRVIVVRSQDQSRDELVQSLSGFESVFIWHRQKSDRDPGALQQKEVEFRRKLRESKDEPFAETPHLIRWIVRGREIPAPRSNTRGHSPISLALVVVWQPNRTSLERLDRLRRSNRSVPHLWIPGIPLEQAKQEVIAAMAAME